MDSKKLYVNFGFWDAVSTDREEGHYNKRVEAEVRAPSGSSRCIRCRIIHAKNSASSTTARPTSDSRPGMTRVVEPPVSMRSVC